MNSTSRVTTGSARAYPEAAAVEEQMAQVAVAG